MKPIKDINEEIDLLSYLKVHDERIYIFYLILRYTAFRASDILPLQIRDIKGDEIVIREKKTKNRVNKEERHIPIHEDLKEVLNEYIQGKYDYEVLFPSQKGVNKHLSYEQAYRILKKASESIGINDFGTHSGRKTCAYHIYMNTRSLKKVQNFLMHDSKRDTIRYVGIEKEVRNDTIKDISSPLALIKNRGK
ncbi:site-specific integrase [Clostridium botulinum]|nr:site-specific integrase [Clostridium botulinum]